MPRPRDLCPITGQPIVCSTCGRPLSESYLFSHNCPQDEEGCEGNFYPGYNERFAGPSPFAYDAFQTGCIIRDETTRRQGGKQ